MQPTSAVGNRGTRGVTLIEMLVVVIVIALIVSVSTPSVTAGIDAVRLNTAASSVAAFLNAAATRADRKERPVELIVSAGERTLRMVSTDPGSLRDMILPQGITIHPAEPVSEDGEGASRWLFLPGGAVPGVAIILGNEHGGRRLIKLDPMTGFPRVESGEAK